MCVWCGGGGVYVCVCSVWGVYVCTHLCRHLQKPKVNPGYVPLLVSTFFEATSLIEPEVHSFKHIGWPAIELPECTSSQPTNAA